AAARPAAQHDLLVAPFLLGVANVGAEVQDHFLHDQRRIVLGEAGARAQHVHARLRHRLRHRQKLQRGRRVHVDGESLGRLAPGHVAQALEVDHPLRADEPVDLPELRSLRVLDVDPLRGDFEAHSADAFEAFTARPHFAASAATNLAASSSDCGAGTRPMPWMRSLRSGALIAATISAFSFCSTSRGVPAVVKRPYHPYASKPGRPDSATVGTSGIWGERFAPDTASILIRPLWTNCARGPSALKVRCTSPETSS